MISDLLYSICCSLSSLSHTLCRSQTSLAVLLDHVCRIWGERKRREVWPTFPVAAILLAHSSSANNCSASRDWDIHTPIVKPQHVSEREEVRKKKRVAEQFQNLPIWSGNEREKLHLLSKQIITICRRIGDTKKGEATKSKGKSAECGCVRERGR